MPFSVNQFPRRADIAVDVDAVVEVSALDAFDEVVEVGGEVVVCGEEAAGGGVG